MNGLIMFLSMTFYLILSCWMLTRGWPMRAGITMMSLALLPWAVWLSVMQGPLGPGAGIHLMVTAVMLLLALIPMGFGAARAITDLKKIAKRTRAS
jgi:hypothetical protein